MSTSKFSITLTDQQYRQCEQIAAKRGPCNVMVGDVVQQLVDSALAAQFLERTPPERDELRQMHMGRPCIHCGKKFGDHHYADESCPIEGGFADEQFAPRRPISSPERAINMVDHAHSIQECPLDEHGNRLNPDGSLYDLDRRLRMHNGGAE